MSASRADPALAAAAAASLPEADAARRSVLLADLEPALQALLQTWLGEIGLRGAPADAVAPVAPALLLIGLPYPRQGSTARLRELARAWPGVPVIALSPTLLAGVAARGDVARQLGVQAVLATPVARDALLGAVRAVLEESVP